jgi:hypothetical protein
MTSILCSQTSSGAMRTTSTLSPFPERRDDLRSQALRMERETDLAFQIDTSSLPCSSGPAPLGVPCQGKPALVERTCSCASMIPKARSCGRANSELAVNGTNVYVTGWTLSSVAGQASLGMHDALIVRLSTAGESIRRHQFGSSNLDDAFGFSVDVSGISLTGLTGAGFRARRMRATSIRSLPGWKRQTVLKGSEGRI